VVEGFTIQESRQRLDDYSGKEFLLDLAATINHHFPTFFDDLNDLPDYRKRKEYEMYEIVFGNLLIFLTRSGSRNQFDLSVNQNMADNILKLFDVKLSIGDNLDKVISRLSAECLSELKVKMIKHLITKKRLDHLRFDGHFLIAFDGTGLYHYDYEPFEGCPYFYFTKLKLKFVFYALGIGAASFFDPQRAKKIQRIARPVGKRPNIVK